MSDTESVNLDAWQAEQGKASGITTEQLDSLAQKYQDLYDEYEKLKAESSNAYKLAEEAEGKLVEALEQAGKSKYIVEGLGTFYFIDKMVVKTPKTNEDKKRLFNWIKRKRGGEYLMTITSINHQTLQSLYKAEQEAAVQENPEKAASFHLPGLEAPTSMRSLGFRKAK